MIGSILICFLLQIAFTIGAIVLFGFLIALCNKRFYANFGNYGMTVCYITGAIGTPLHECAHALFCVIFGHKITEIKLFQINSSDGTLGYVKHNYNPKNVYHKIGNFFIGIAPVVVISSVLYLLAWLLLPSFVADMNANFNAIDFMRDIGNVLESFYNVLQSFFSCALSWQWWVFLLVGISLALHMTLSGADIKIASNGIVFLLVTALVANVILGLIDEDILIGFTQGVLSVASYLICLLVLGLLMSIMAVIVSYAFKVLKRK